MNLKKIIAIAAGVILLAIIIIKLKSNKDISEQRIYQYDQEEAINVEVDTLALKIIQIADSYPGTFEPNKETRISAEIQGKISHILVDVGSEVQKGQVLIQLDNSLLKLQLQTVEVQIEGLEADVSRYTILAEADAIQGVQLEKALTALKTAKVQRATILEQINKTGIVAPFSGIVTAKLSEEGAFAAPGIPLLQITDIKTLKFTANVSEDEISNFKIEQHYTLISDAYPEIELIGKATMIGSKANMGNSFPIQFSVANTNDKKIKSGMFGKVIRSQRIKEEGITIPSSAIQGSNSAPKVYIMENGKAMLRNIVVGQRIDNQAVISSGLHAGDIIITSGFINLFDGANVMVK